MTDAEATVSAPVAEPIIQSEDEQADSSETAHFVDNQSNGEKPLSKTQLKKMKKRENRLAYRAIKRKEEKLRKKEKRKLAIERGEDLGPTRKALKMRKMKDSLCKVNVVIDCSFDDYMQERDIHMLVKQIQHCYSINRRAEQPIQCSITSVSGKTRDVLDRIGDYKHWDVNIKADDYMEVFGKENIVYLSSESSNVLTSLDDSKVYVIGGLVDHNHQKGLCHRLAEEKDIAHAQLPIGEFLEMKTRKVLTIDHVFEILLRYTESSSWEEAFFKVLPKRKGAVAKSTLSDASETVNNAGSNSEDIDTSVITSSDMVTPDHSDQDSSNSASNLVVDQDKEVDS